MSDALSMADSEVFMACSSHPPASNTLCVYGEVAGTPGALDRLTLYDEILSSMYTHISQCICLSFFSRHNASHYQFGT